MILVFELNQIISQAIGHNETWTYKYPANWYMNSTDSIKTNSRTNINDPKIFIQSEFFIGPSRSKEAMRKVINNKFKQLKNKSIILRYKIRTNYPP